MRNSFSGKPLSVTGPCQNVANEVANCFNSIFEVDIDKFYKAYKVKRQLVVLERVCFFFERGVIDPKV